MAYTALYRKFRPTTFSEMVGQEHITRTLKNQIIAGRVGHAYLFNGGRGTGKTSAAKILARAVNCLNPQNGEPCNECEICKAALNGSLIDIVEMDAASNNSVEDIRQIRDEVNFLPTKAKYRVYIIDEVHMLSIGAFNALLKTLEEPPEHVKFILATTEPQKLPATILSRCQRFDFKKISEEDISKRLEIVCKESNIEITPQALKIISNLAEGAMRDALSILERCIQDGENQIDEEKIKDLVGIPKFEYINNITKSIIEKNAENALSAINDVINEGKDISNLLWETIKYVKDILVYKTSKKTSIYNDEEIKQIDELSKKIEKERLLSIIYELSNLENDMKYSTQKTILFQVGILKLCMEENFINTYSRNVENTPKYIANITNNPKQNVGGGQLNQPQAIKPRVNNEGTKKQENIKTNAQTINNGKEIKDWPQIVSSLKQEGKILLYTNLINSNVIEINDMTVGITFPKGLTPFGKTILEKQENINELEKKVSMKFGKPMKIKIIQDNINQKSAKSKEESQIENFAENLDLPFNVIE